MKKKVILISTIVLALLISVATIAVCMEMQKNPEVDSDLYHYDKGVMTEKLYTAPDGTQIALTYKQSLERADGTSLHYYMDKYGTEYRFDPSGELIGCSENRSDFYAEKPKDDTTTEKPLADKANDDIQPNNNSALAADAKATQQEKQIIEIARQYAIDTFGEEYFSKFSYTRMIKQPATKTHYVRFHIRYNERFITEGCLVTLVNEKPHRISLSGKGGDNGFDPTLLKNVKIATLEEFVKQTYADKYSQKYHSYTMNEDISVSLNDSGKYELIISVNLQIDPEFSTPELVHITYPLE